MIVSADWLVSLLLGPKWMGTSKIFSILGLVGFVQPVAGTTGWLFVTQGRTNDMFRWGLIGSSITVLGIASGLKWGAVGMATSYSLTTSFVVIPVLFWYVTKSGPVRMIDIYRTIAPVLLAAGVSVLVSLPRGRLALMDLKQSIAVMFHKVPWGE